MHRDSAPTDRAAGSLEIDPSFTGATHATCAPASLSHPRELGAANLCVSNFTAGSTAHLRCGLSWYGVVVDLAGPLRVHFKLGQGDSDGHIVANVDGGLNKAKSCVDPLPPTQERSAKHRQVHRQAYRQCACEHRCRFR